VVGSEAISASKGEFLWTPRQDRDARASREIPNAHNPITKDAPSAFLDWVFRYASTL
jgi:hypothetical protein